MGEHGTPGEPDRGSGLVLDDGTLRITWRSGEPPIMVLAGEVDEASYPGLVAALTGAAAHYDEIHLDLAGLGYCDLAGLRAIVRLASPDGARGQAGGAASGAGFGAHRAAHRGLGRGRPADPGRRLSDAGYRRGSRTTETKNSSICRTAEMN